jgi:mannose-6-phosphate isomerase-like protein (cupin superfamily)
MADGRGFVVLPGEPRRADIGAIQVLVLADRPDTDGAFSLVETIDAAAGGGPPLHVHRDAAESFFVIEGAYRMHVDGRDFDCPAGSFIHVPKGVVHTFQSRVAGSRKLNLYTPAAMVGYFDELADAVRSGLDDAGLDAIAERHNMEVVGPVPDGYL